MCRVVVEPIDAGWVVAVEGVDNPLVYRSGRAAEEAARGLAMRLARRGGPVSLEVRLRGGAVAGRFIVQPHETARSTPATDASSTPAVRRPQPFSQAAR